VTLFGRWRVTNALSSTVSFFNGWRSTPGTMPTTTSRSSSSLAPRYTASLMDWKLKSRVLIGGTTMAAPMSPDPDALTRIARPIASRFLR
jgi:hypothetical protein